MVLGILEFGGSGAVAWFGFGLVGCDVVTLGFVVS